MSVFYLEIINLVFSRLNIEVLMRWFEFFMIFFFLLKNVFTEDCKRLLMRMMIIEITVVLMN